MTATIRAEASKLATIRTTELDGRRVVLASIVPSELDRREPRLSASDSAALAEAVRSACRQRLPVVLVVATVGVEVGDGIGASDAWARVARELVRASGQIPILMVASGPVVAGPALLLGLADVTIFTADAYAFLNGPRSVEAYTGVPTSGTKLGGSGAHARASGLASLVVTDVPEALEAAGEILAFLPSTVDELPPIFATDDPVDRLTPEALELLPATQAGSYDVRDVIRTVCDDEEFLELRAAWAPNLVIGFATLGGHPVGVVANQTCALAGSIDIAAAQKGARFVAMCDAFNVPLLTLIDTSGFLPGKDLEWRGMIRHGAQLAFAYARATVPRVALILRKSYGGAYIVMDSQPMGNDVMLAWPTAEVAVMGAKGAVEILHRKASPEERLELEKQYEKRHLTPYEAAERSSISNVIDPAETRRELVAALTMLRSKRERLRNRRHDNTPL